MKKNTEKPLEPFATKFRGLFYGMSKWHHLDQLWLNVKAQMDDNWYIYAVGHEVPETTSRADRVLKFVDEMDALLHKEHDEEYCGIVYADNAEEPAFIKIFDPNNLGVSCGFSDNPPLPGWIMSKMKPSDLQAAFPPAKSRQRWWGKIFA
ncbi:MAG: hypothetical protein OEY29_13640 [Gammaproteobacteria bacterium]|nr:hypothetical protein [Gammaproteobacteria bacterium]